MDKLVEGDKVLVLPRISNVDSYYGCYTDEMLQYANEVATITISKPTHCLLDIDEGGHIWDPKALLKLDKPVNYYSLSEGKTVVFKIGDEYIKGIVKVSSLDRYYIQPECAMNELNKLCSMTIKELTKKFSGKPREILIAKDKEKLREMLDFINDLATVETVKFDDKPINQEHYVVKLQRTKASVRRAEVPKGSRVCSKINKAAISIQPLSHTICFR